MHFYRIRKRNYWPNYTVDVLSDCEDFDYILDDTIPQDIPGQWKIHSSALVDVCALSFTQTIKRKVFPNSDWKKQDINLAITLQYENISKKKWKYIWKVNHLLAIWRIFLWKFVKLPSKLQTSGKVKRYCKKENKDYRVDKPDIVGQYNK